MYQISAGRHDLSHVSQPTQPLKTFSIILNRHFLVKTTSLNTWNITRINTTLNETKLISFEPYGKNNETQAKCTFLYGEH